MTHRLQIPLIATALIALATTASGRAQNPGPPPIGVDDKERMGTILDRVGFDQKLGGVVPLDAEFRDENGRAVKLGDYFGKRPVVLDLVYYQCPLLCTQTLNGLTRSLKPLAPSIGKDFEVLTVSISPEEGPEMSRLKKAGYLKRYGRPGPEAAAGWHFLTGKKDQIDRLARSVGFRYNYNPRTRLYAHAAGIVVLTPEGKISRYFYGIDYPAKDLQFALVESSSGKVGTPIARILLLCYDYDAASGKYTLAILRLVRVFGGATAVGLAAYMALMFRRDRRAGAVGPRPIPAASLN